MKLIKHSMLKISYLNKLPFKGSFQGVRYIFKKTDDNKLRLCTYPDEFCFEKTDDALKKYYEFDYSENGIQNAIDFLNEEYKW